MALGDFFKKLFGTSTKEMADKAESFAEEAIEKAKVAAAPMIDKVEDFVTRQEKKLANIFRQREKLLILL